MSFIHLQLREQDRIVQCGGYLTDAAADAVHHLSAQIGRGHIIAVLLRKRLHRLIGGKAFSRIDRVSVDQLAAVRHIRAPVRTRRRIAGGIGPQHVLHHGQLLRVPLRLLLRHRQIHGSVAAPPLGRQIIINRRLGGRVVDHHSRLPFLDDKLSVFSRQMGVDGFHIVLRALIFDQGGDSRPVKGKLDLIYLVLMRQILHGLIAGHHVSGLSQIHRIFHQILVAPGHAQLRRRRRHRIAVHHVQRDHATSQGIHIGLDRFLRLRLSHSRQGDLSGVHALPDRIVRPRLRMNGNTGNGAPHSQHQQKGQCKHPFSRSIHRHRSIPAVTAHRPGSVSPSQAPG